MMHVEGSWEERVHSSVNSNLLFQYVVSLNFINWLSDTLSSGSDHKHCTWSADRATRSALDDHYVETM